MPDESANGWAEWSRHVLLELKRLNDSLEALISAHHETEQEITRVESDLRNKNNTCRDHLKEVRELRKEIDATKHSVNSQRLLSVTISSVTSIIVAGVTGYFLLRASSGGP